jgi:hypothetical protein
MRSVTLTLCLVVALLAAVSATLTASRALADADPPSDVLLLQDVYYPYQPKVSPRFQAQLDDLTARARRAGFPIKVALVASPADLGAVPQLFGHVARYARFLERELEYNRPRPTLAVMPDGYGTAATGPNGPAIVSRLAAPRTSEGMARGAIVAVERLAAANGHPLDASQLGIGKTHHSGTSVLLVFAPLALLALGFAALALRRRRATTQLPADDTAEPYDWSHDG